MRNMLGVMWNVSLSCDIVWTVSHFLTSGSSLVYDVDGPAPMLLSAACDSPICLRNYHMSASSS
jgi:hypothetical protein